MEATGRKFLEVRANLMELDDIPSIIESTLTEFGRIDILVNNAGIIRRNDAIDFSEKDWDDVMNINIKSLFFSISSRSKTIYLAR